MALRGATTIGVEHQASTAAKLENRGLPLGLVPAGVASRTVALYELCHAQRNKTTVSVVAHPTTTTTTP